MNFQLLCSLDDDLLFKGIKEYFYNSKKLFETAEDLAVQKKYGIATALTVLSIEELIKSYAVFSVYTGVTDADITDPAFIGPYIHKNRLKLAFTNSFVFDLINQKEMEKFIEKIIQMKKIETEPEFKNMNQLFDWIEISDPGIQIELQLMMKLV